jgi:hypothetical protein
VSAYDDELERIRQIEAEAERRRKALPSFLRHPDHWKVGMRVRYVRDSYDGWGPNAGTVGTVLRVRDPERRGSEYQVFWVRPDNDTRAQFWTTPEDVELLADETVSR